MGEALALGERARGRSAPNPNVGCVIVSAAGRTIGRGATAAGGRPHAEAIALEQAGKRAKGATVFTTVDGSLQSNTWNGGSTIFSFTLKRPVGVSYPSRPIATRNEAIARRVSPSCSAGTT